MTKPYKGAITGWKLEKRKEFFVITGVIGEDYIRTSPLVGIDFDTSYIETQNSIYSLEGPHRD